MKRFFLLPLALLCFAMAVPGFAAKTISASFPEKDPKVFFEIRFDEATSSLIADVTIEEGWKIYAYDNAEMGGFSTDTAINVSGGLEALKEWKDTPESELLNVDANGDTIEGSLDDYGWKGFVNLVREMKRLPGETASVVISGQVCDEGGTCNNFTSEALTLDLPKYIPPPEPEAQTDFGDVDISNLSHSAFVKGYKGGPEKLVEYSAAISDGMLVITVKHAEDWHTYAFNNKEEGGYSEDTVISVVGGLNVVGDFIASVEARDVGDEAYRAVMDGKGDWIWEGELTFTAKVKKVADKPTLIQVSGCVSDSNGTQFTFPDESSVVHLLLPEVDALALAGESRGGGLTAAEVLSMLRKERVKVLNGVEKLLNPEKEDELETKAFEPKKEREGESEFKDESDINEMGWLAFIGLCVGGGLLALLMPCVFPMIPITVSFFGKQAEASEGSTVTIAIIYGLGVVISYTALGAILSIFWNVGQFGNNVYVATGIGVFFLVFALSMFGLFELRLPHGMAQKFNMQGKASGSAGAFLLGLTFAVTSMACTVPVVGLIMASATAGDWTRPIIGMLIYSSVVALPFVVLGTVPGLLNKVPRAGGWMNTVKIIFAFVELAAAAEFFGWAHIISREVVLAIWIACLIGGALYLLGVFRSKHDVATAGIGPLRIIFATIFIALVFTLVPALDGTPLRSDFVEAFLRASDAPSTAKDSGEPWIKNPPLKEVLADAKMEGRPVFIDITGKN